MNNIFFEITLIISLAATLSLLFRTLKQPAILAYILTGIIIGPFGKLELTGVEFLQTMSEFGITLLLFMLGLEFKLKDLRSVGKVSTITGIAQILFTSLIGFFISKALGFSDIHSLYISIALTFSSTVIIVKLLSDKKDLNSLYGKISVGFLLVQDFFAIILLMFISGFGETQTFALGNMITVILKGVSLFALVVYLSKSTLPKLVDIVARSSELLFLSSIAFALSVAALVSAIGFSIEIGGFLAGLALANSSEHFQIEARTRALRDFFIVIFFVILGMSMSFADVLRILNPAIILSLFVLIGNPLIVMVIMGFMGYRKRTSFLAGLTVAQISEFSLILVFLGQKVGHLSSEIVSLITVVGVITFTASTYLILNGNKLYEVFAKYFGIFERKETSEELLGETKDLKNHVVLIGVNRTGGSVLDALLSHGEKVVAIDFNPDIIKEIKALRLRSGQVTSLFGDISDFEIQEKAGLPLAKLVVSTIPDVDDNIELISQVSSRGRSASDRKKRPKVIVVAENNREEEELYKAGADYVIQPHVLGGRHLAHLIKTDSLFH